MKKFISFLRDLLWKSYRNGDYSSSRDALIADLRQRLKDKEAELADEKRACANLRQTLDHYREDAKRAREHNAVNERIITRLERQLDDLKKQSGGGKEQH